MRINITDEISVIFICNIQETIFLEEDDIYCFDHDKGRLFQAVLEIFHANLRYPVPKEIANHDVVGIYVKIMAHLNSQRGRDADIAREAFVKYKMNESLTFKQERSEFEEVFKTLEYAQRSPIIESDKIQFLTKRMMLDNRVGLKDVMVQSLCNDLSYERTIDLLIKVNCEMSEGDQTIKLAGMHPPKSNNSGKQKPGNSDNPIKYCYNFNESGECRFGASCIYSHSKDPNHLTREPRSKPLPDKSQPPNPVGKLHRSPNGGEKFKGGYKGKNPRVKFNKVNSSDDNASFKSITVNNIDEESKSPSSLLPFQSWSNLDQEPISIGKELLNNLSMKMIKSKDSVQSEHESDFPDDHNDIEVPVSRSSDFSNRFNTIKPIQELQLQHSRRTKGSPLQNLEAVHNQTPLMQMTFFHNTAIRFKYPTNVEYAHPDEQGGLLSFFTGFKWNPRCSRSGDVVEEIRNPTGSLMEMIYRMNEIFMGAIVVHATPITPVSKDHAGNFDIAQYTNFRSMGSRENKPGYYKSTITELKSYITILKTIYAERNDPNLQTGNIYLAESTVQLMVWGVVYDFMSFCTNLYGHNFEQYQTSIADSRLQLISDIAEYHTTDFSFKNLQNVFLSIAKSANGILANAFIPKMINDHEQDSDNENDLNGDNNDNESDDSDTESNVNAHNAPAPKRQCNRMSTFGQHK